MRKDDDVRLRHMLDAAREALGFVRGRNRVDLNSDRQLVLALVKTIEIIGEAAFRTSENTQAQFPEIRWEDIVGMRHRLVHAYFDINLDVLWKTVQDDLVPLIVRLEQMLGTKPPPAS
ncbi:DUF86 domain-containing protein [Nitrospira sp. BLG_2]|uniref:HepT-like ribonuclease domain-containing protein n=1 Tax=Nitrospira sp. BLG_2 TaxID=3397507 RepID=UPI003B99DC53